MDLDRTFGQIIADDHPAPTVSTQKALDLRPDRRSPGDLDTVQQAQYFTGA